jgi:Protein of unknown function (DUF1071).
MSKFFKLLGVDVRPFVKHVEGMAYLPWALALVQAGRPAWDAVLFDTPLGRSHVRRLFGGNAVAVDMDIEDGTGVRQRIYLPILNAKGKPVPAGQETARDASDTLARCAARAVAIVHGFGLSLYSECEGDGPAYVQALGVTPDTRDLTSIPELRDIKEIKNRQGVVIRAQEYLGWHAAIAAARITDPSFRWEILEDKVVDPNTGAIETLPAFRVPGKGWLVGVRVFWRGTAHTQWLPIMGVETVQTRNGPKPMEHQPIAEPDVFHWHSAVMRCLAKGIALATGYGIASYAGEIAVSGLDTEAPEAEAPSPGAPQPQPRPTQEPVSVRLRELVGSVRDLIRRTATDEKQFLSWLGVESLESAGPSRLERGQAALMQKLSRQQGVPATATAH